LVKPIKVTKRVRLPLGDNNIRINPKPRIESLSDLIFGLALSLSAYSLLSSPPTDPIKIGADILSFTFSFLLLIFVWIRYTSIMSVLPTQDSTTRFLNIAMLFTVSLEPYLFYLIGLYDQIKENLVVEYASILFAVDMAGLVLIMAFFTNELAKEERQLLSMELIKPFKKTRNIMLVSAILFLFTIMPQLWAFTIFGLPARFLLWLIPLFIFFAARIPEKNTNR
jgi:uncharacterized membrane protein